MTNDNSASITRVMNSLLWGQGPTQFFYRLEAPLIFKALEDLGLRPTGSFLALNSFENRVYDLGVNPFIYPRRVDDQLLEENHSQVVVKFYRPGRWSEEQILEEHQFLFDLQEIELSVVAPLVFEGKSLFQEDESKLWYALFPRRAGRAPQDLGEAEAERLGRLLARAHLCGKRRKSHGRPILTPENYGQSALENILSGPLAPSFARDRIEKSAHGFICAWMEIWPKNFFRIHGDLHPGNILNRNDLWWLLDFDDFCQGPAIQDFWMLLPDPNEQRELWISFSVGYETFSPFPWGELPLIEGLRTLRQLHFAGWVSKRWEDPAFPGVFGHYQGENLWWDLLQKLEATRPHKIYE